VISTSKQTLAIVDTAGATQQSYLEARCLDPAQGQAVHPIQLTSLRATAADEPYGGSDGGLIGIHYQEVSSGAVTHGCVRLDEQAIQAVNALPLGTPVSIVA
jgi:lipoprotein-anchoring transpeptidase ErfK/SrfK